MEKRKRIINDESMNDELPEDSIQHIQSFLNGKEAARTTILSKSWYNAWLTRPNLDLDEADIPKNSDIPPSESAFVKLAEKTVQRYEELKLKIQSLRLRMDGYLQEDKVSLANETITKAMKLGATDLVIEWDKFVLPCEVLDSETLVKLSVVGCIIDQQEDWKISGSRLKSLNFSKMFLKENTILEIISKCPLIEELVLSQCKDLPGAHNALALKSGFGANDFRKLKVLSLEHVKIGEWLFGDLSSKFPCLKELTLDNCTGYEEIQIRSDSLERLAFYQRMKLRGKFDVPRIRKFEFDGPYVPCLSFKTTSTSTEWESDISFIRCTVNSSWFVKLREFLLELSSSKINLYLLIIVPCEKGFEYASHTIGLPIPPIVEKLRVLVEVPISVQSPLLEDIFWSCRPKFIILYSSTGRLENYDVVKLICNTLIDQEDRENQNTFALHDLKEINVDVSGRTVWTWSRPQPSKTLDASPLSGCVETKVNLERLFSGTIDASAFWGWTNQTKICLRLTWE